MPPLHPNGRDDAFHELLHRRLQNEDPADGDLAFDTNEDDAADLALMREALGNYKTETLRFAEQQSASMPAPRVPKAVALWDSTPRWAVAATAVLALGFTTVFVTHRHPEPAPLTMAAAPTAQALRDDNRLLLSVDEALNTSVAPTAEELGLTAIPAHNTKHGRATN